MKKAICVILAAVLCFCAIPAFAEEETPETTYTNSLILYVTSDVQRTFSPSDFSDAGCVKAETTSMCLNDEGKYVYRELLTLDRSGDEAMDDLVKAFDGKAFRNIYADDYYRYANRVNLSANEVYVPLGKTLSVSVTGKEVNAPPYLPLCGIDVTVDPETLDEQAFAEGKIQGLEGYDIYALAEDDVVGTAIKEAELGRIFYDEYPKATGRVSEFHRYLLTKSGKDDFNGLMQTLSVLPGVTAAVRAYSYVGYMWTQVIIEDEENVSVANGQIASGECVRTYPDPDNNRFYFVEVNITGKSVGDTEAEVVLSGKGYTCFGKIAVHVFLQGDVDFNGKITASDALLALQAAIGKISFTEQEKRAAKFDEEPEVGVTDALMILQYSVGKF